VDASGEEVVSRDYKGVTDRNLGVEGIWCRQGVIFSIVEASWERLAKVFVSNKGERKTLLKCEGRGGVVESTYRRQVLQGTKVVATDV